MIFCQNLSNFQNRPSFVICETTKHETGRLLQGLYVQNVSQVAPYAKNCMAVCSSDFQESNWIRCMCWNQFNKKYFKIGIKIFGVFLKLSTLHMKKFCWIFSTLQRVADFCRQNFQNQSRRLWWFSWCPIWYFQPKNIKICFCYHKIIINFSLLHYKCLPKIVGLIIESLL